MMMTPPKNHFYQNGKSVFAAKTSRFQILAGKKYKNWSRFFAHFFPWKITFRGIYWENYFSKTFPRKSLISPNILGEKIFRGKYVRKIDPLISRSPHAIAWACSGDVGPHFCSHK
jgi:hypothetical protein